MTTELEAARHSFDVAVRLRDEGHFEIEQLTIVDALVQTVQHLLWHLEAAHPYSPSVEAGKPS